MTEIHRMVAFTIPTGFALLALWTLYTFVRNRPPHDLYWSFLALLQGILGVQVAIGIVLFVLGGRPATQGPEWLHYFYGGVFPIAVLVLAHGAARSKRFEGVPWLPFGVASLVIFGLTFRALQTGLGIG